MSSAVWPFRFTLRPKSLEMPTFKTRIAEGNEGNDQRAAEFGDDFKLRVLGSIRFPQTSTGKTLADWLAFVEARLGRYDPFLYSPWTQRYRTVTLEAVGTGDGSTTAFALDSRYIDASTLLVYKAGVLQTLTTHYTFSGNNTAPLVTFVSAPTGGQAITATYDRYFPMFLEDDGHEPVYLASQAADASRPVRIDGVELLETAPGGHLV